MTQDDFKKLKTVVREEVSLIVKKEISASEKRLKEEISTSASKVLGDIGQFMEDNLFPMIDEKADKTDIDRLERKLDRFIDTIYEHESRIKDVEQVPVIAHELKLKKSKANHD